MTRPFLVAAIAALWVAPVTPVRLSIASVVYHNEVLEAVHEAGPVIGVSVLIRHQVASLIDVGVGNTSVRFVVDTGSSTMIVPEVGCDCDCLSNRTEFYKCFASRTCQPCDLTPTTRCEFQVGYMDGTKAMGSRVGDVVQVGNLSVIHRFALARAFRRTACHPEPFQGILGLGDRSLNTDAGEDMTFPTLLDDVALATGGRHVFTLYLGQVSKGDGYLTVGAADLTAASAPIAYADYQTSEYFVSILGVSIKNSYIEARDAVLIDSGTTMIELTEALFDAVKTELEQYCPFGSSSVIGRLTQSPPRYLTFRRFSYSEFPALTISFSGGANITVYPHHYLIPHPTRSSTFVFAIRSQKIHFHILGAAFMSAGPVVFDRETGRIGFAQGPAPEGYTAPSKCGAQKRT